MFAHSQTPRWSSICRSGLAAGSSGSAGPGVVRSSADAVCCRLRARPAANVRTSAAQLSSQPSTSSQRCCHVLPAQPPLGARLPSSSIRRAQRCSNRDRRRVVRTVASLADLVSPLLQCQAWLTAAASSVEQLPPACYGLYMLAASFGVPLSEDALVVWVGSNLWRGVYGAGARAAAMLAYLFALVVLSDMCTFWLGRALRSGPFAPLKDRLLRDKTSIDKAAAEIAKWSVWIGLVQRFTYGFPVCLAAGFLGVRTMQFAGGVAAGSAITMGVQMGGAFLLRDNPAMCMTAIAVCNVLEVAPPLVALAGLGARWAVRRLRSGDHRMAAAATAAAAPSSEASDSSSSSASESHPLPAPVAMPTQLQAAGHSAAVGMMPVAAAAAQSMGQLLPAAPAPGPAMQPVCSAMMQIQP